MPAKTEGKQEPITAQFADGFVTIAICSYREFQDGTDQTRELGKGITAVFAVLECDETDAQATPEVMTPPVTMDTTDAEDQALTIRAIRFDLSLFSIDQALKWMMDFQSAVGSIEFSGQYVVERVTDMFEAGDYPDRGMNVTEADIARLATQTDPIPIHMEHTGAAWTIGEVTGLNAAGRWLRGKMNLLPEAAALIDKLGIKGVSVQVSRNCDRIHELSVTATPRVAAAQMYSQPGCAAFALGESPTGGFTMPEAVTQEQFSTLQAQFATIQEALEAEKAARATAEASLQATTDRANHIEFALRVKDATAKVDALQRAGKLPPAAREEAISLLLSGGMAKFSDGDKPVAELVTALLEKLPAHFSGPIKGDAANAPALTPEQQKFFSAHFKPDQMEKLAAAMSS